MFAQFDERGWVARVATAPWRINLDVVRSRLKGRESRISSEHIPQPEGEWLPGHANAQDQSPRCGVWYAVEYRWGRGRGRFVLRSEGAPPPEWFIWRVQGTRAGHACGVWYLESPVGLQRALDRGDAFFPFQATE